jgi:hypothetical protein
MLKVWDKQSEMQQSWFPRATLRSGIMSGHRVADAGKNAAQIATFGALDVRCIVDLHTDPTYTVMTFESQELFAAKIKEVFDATGETDPSGKTLPQNNVTTAKHEEHDTAATADAVE